MNILTKLFEKHDVGIDFGTANLRVWVKDKGMVMDEPSAVAIEVSTKRVLAVGEEVKRLCAIRPDVVAIRRVKSGVIADFDITKAMLSHSLAKVKMVAGRTFRRPRIVVAVPSGITEVEKRAVEDSAHDAGAGEVFQIEGPMAAAIGAGLPVTESVGSMIVDIGGGVCEAAIISQAGIVHSYSTRACCGDAMDEAIMNYIQRAYNRAIDERTAEDIKIKIGSAVKLDSEIDYELKGFDVAENRPSTLAINSREIREEALAGVLDQFKEAIKILLNRSELKLVANLKDRGIVLTGGGALLPGLDKRLGAATGFPVCVADDPAHATIDGTAVVAEELDFLSKHASK